MFVISSEAGFPCSESSCGATSGRRGARVPTPVGRNLSWSLVSGFCRTEEGVAEGCGIFGAAAFPTVKYFRILSSLFFPIPLIASRSSTLLNEPYDFRICTIFSAVTGPIPGTCCNSSEFAVLILTGFAGGFFFAHTVGAPAKTTPSSAASVHAIRRLIAIPSRSPLAWAFGCPQNRTPPRLQTAPPRFDRAAVPHDHKPHIRRIQILP